MAGAPGQPEGRQSTEAQQKDRARATDRRYNWVGDPRPQLPLQPFMAKATALWGHRALLLLQPPHLCFGYRGFPREAWQARLSPSLVFQKRVDSRDTHRGTAKPLWATGWTGLTSTQDSAGTAWIPLTARGHPQPLRETSNPATTHRPGAAIRASIHKRIVAAHSMSAGAPTWEGGLCGGRSTATRHQTFPGPRAPPIPLTSCQPKDESALTFDQGVKCPPLPGGPPLDPTHNPPTLPAPITRLHSHPYLQSAGHPLP